MACTTRRRLQYSSEHWTDFAASLSSDGIPTRYTVSEGVLIFFDTLMISVRRGTPRVTFFAETPAKWNVFRVICVVGSPMLWAATVPTASPGDARDAIKRCSTSRTTSSNARESSLYSESTRLDARVERTSEMNSSVAFD